MKERLRVRWEQSALKAWADRKLHLSREKKLVVSLTVVLVAGLCLWGLAGYPLPTAEMEFRRLERSALLPRSQIVFATPELHRSALAISGSDRTVTALDGTELTLNGKWLVGVAEGRAAIAQVGRSGRDRRIWAIPLREDGPTLLPLDGGTWSDTCGYWVEEGPMPGGYRYDYHHFMPLLVLNAPEETAWLEAVVEDEAGELRTGAGWDLGSGVWLVGVEKEHLSGWELGRSYTLRIYDGSGGLVLEQSGALPEPT